MPRRHDNSFALYVGNLHEDSSIRNLKERIIELIREIGPVLSNKSVWVVTNGGSLPYAFIYLNTKEDFVVCLRNLTEHLDRYDVSDIVNPGCKLKVHPKLTRRDHQEFLSRSETEDGAVNSVLNPEEYYSADNMTRPRPSPGNSPNWQSTIEQTQQSSHLLLPKVNLRKLPMHLTKTSPMSDTVLVYHGANAHGHINPNEVSSFKYVIDNKLGNETRNVEFKCGQGNFIHKQLVHTVTKYMCAFLNSEGGVLVVGVQDDGTIKGIPEITRQCEDDLRLKIDSAVKLMSPKVFPSMYRNSFLNVSDRSGFPIEDLKVIEVEVEKGTSDQLYETGPGDVFIRRDGSVQGPLKYSDIQEWTRVQLERGERRQRKKDKEVATTAPLLISSPPLSADLQDQLEQLKRSKTRLQNSVSLLKRDNAELKERSEQLEEERDYYMERSIKNERSKVCVIS